MVHKPRAIEEFIASQLQESAEVKITMSQSGLSTIAQMAELLIQVLRNGGKVVLFGNGGSAADAQHIATELAGRYRLDRSPLPALALTTNTSILTAVANDYSFDQVFSRQVEALIAPSDIAVGISTSGQSPNVLRAIEVARSKGATTLGLTGQKGLQLAAAVDLCLTVPSTDTPRIQEAHITVGHILCDLVERALFGQERG